MAQRQNKPSLKRKLGSMAAKGLAMLLISGGTAAAAFYGLSDNSVEKATVDNHFKQQGMSQEEANKAIERTMPKPAPKSPEIGGL